MSTIGRVLQIVIETAELAWMDQGRCAEVGNDEWFPEKGGSTREAKAICAQCEVKAECLAYALETDQAHGIWGGLTVHQRRRLKRSEAA